MPKLIIEIGKLSHRLKRIQQIVSYDVMSGAPEYELVYLDSNATLDEGWEYVK